jgi:Zn-finger nucleic acid-binding protein
MQCITCEIDLVPEIYEDTQIDRCARCHGVWLDIGELSKIVATVGVQLPADLVRDTLAMAFRGVSRDYKRLRQGCPSCGAAMEAINYDYSSGIVLDRCPAGHGTWLDGGELDKVQAHAEHWADQAEQHAEDWKSFVQSMSRARADAADENRRRSSRPTRYLVETIIRRCLKA